MAIDALIEMNLVEVTSVGITQLQKVKQKEMTKTYKYVAAWEYKGDDINAEVLHKEELMYENIEVKTRSYK
jgi:hypothetical protein